MVSTMPMFDNKPGQPVLGKNAVEYDDYLPINTRVVFANGESEQRVTVELVKDKVPTLENKDKAEEPAEDENEESDHIEELQFKIVLDKADPDSVKISKKKQCFVSILPDEHESVAVEQEKMLDFFFEKKDPTWASQFKNAIMLSP